MFSKSQDHQMSKTFQRSIITITMATKITKKQLTIGSTFRLEYYSKKNSEESNFQNIASLTSTNEKALIVKIVSIIHSLVKNSY